MMTKAARSLNTSTQLISSEGYGSGTRDRSLLLDSSAVKESYLKVCALLEK